METDGKSRVHVVDHGAGLTLCCGMNPSELPRTDRMTAVPNQLNLPPGVLCDGSLPFAAAPASIPEELVEEACREWNSGFWDGVPEHVRANLRERMRPLLTRAFQRGQGTVPDPQVAIVHCGDMEADARAFNQGYAEAQRQGIGGPESRAWVTQKIETVLGPLTSLRPDLAGQIADQLLTDTDMLHGTVGPLACPNCDGDTFVCGACGVAYDANA